MDEPNHNRNWGGARKGASRPRRDIITKDVRIHKPIYKAFKGYVLTLREEQGEKISLQDCASDIILSVVKEQKVSEVKWDFFVEGVAREVKTWGQPWVHLRLIEQAHEELSQLAASVRVLTPVYTNLGNTLTVLMLRKMKSHATSVLVSEKP